MSYLTDFFYDEVRQFFRPASRGQPALSSDFHRLRTQLFYSAWCSNMSQHATLTIPRTQWQQKPGSLGQTTSILQVGAMSRNVNFGEIISSSRELFAS